MHLPSSLRCFGENRSYKLDLNKLEIPYLVILPKFYQKLFSGLREVQNVFNEFVLFINIGLLI